MQVLLDEFREWRAGWHQDAAKHHLSRRDFWRRQIDRPWPDMIPAALPWLALIVLWTVVIRMFVVFWP